MEQKDKANDTKKCKFCISDIPSEAKRCPQCHADLRLWRKRNPLLVIVILLVVIWIPVSFLSRCYKLYINSVTEADAVNDPSKAVLRLDDSKYTRSAGYVVTEGRITNISSDSQKYVVAVIQWFDENDGFVTSDEAVIDYNPILPGQTSPFSIHTVYNPAMESAIVTFKKGLGGTIPTYYPDAKK